MIFLLKRIIDGLGEPYNKQDAGTKAIISYFKKIYSEDHPGKIAINTSEFKPFLDDIIVKKCYLWMQTNAIRE